MVPGHAYGTHELSVTSPQPGSWTFDEIGQYVWSSGIPTSFLLQYDATTGIARLTIGERTSAWHLVTSPLSAPYLLCIRVRSVRAGSSIRVHNVLLNGVPTSVDLFASTTTQPESFTTLTSGPSTHLHLQGWATLSFPAGANRPHNDQLSFQILVGAATPTEPNLDTDGDNLPDEWEILHFGDPAHCFPDDDADGDGSSNRDEYFAGTDPKNPLSALRISIGTTSITNASLFRSSANTSVTVPVLQWSSDSNRTYSVWRATTLSTGMAGFSPIAENIPGSPPFNMLTDSTATGPGPYYYRVRVHRSP